MHESLLSAMGTDGGKGGALQRLSSASSVVALSAHETDYKFSQRIFFSRVFAFVPSVGKGSGWGMLLVISVQKSKGARQGSYSSAAGPLAGS